VRSPRSDKCSQGFVNRGRSFGWVELSLLWWCGCSRFLVRDSPLGGLRKGKSDVAVLGYES